MSPVPWLRSLHTFHSAYRVHRALGVGMFQLTITWPITALKQWHCPGWWPDNQHIWRHNKLWAFHRHYSNLYLVWLLITGDIYQVKGWLYRCYSDLGGQMPNMMKKIQKSKSFNIKNVVLIEKVAFLINLQLTGTVIQLCYETTHSKLVYRYSAASTCL